MRLPPLPTLRDITRLYKLRAKKQLAQNFILDMGVNQKIVRHAGKVKDSYVLEVGPGPGGITRAIFEAGAKQVTVVEIDSRFLPGLQLLDESTDGRLAIHHGDILRFDADTKLNYDDILIKNWMDDSPNIHVMGNLPFNVSTPLIIAWLEDIANHRGIWKYGRAPLTLTFQKEVAERMIAPMLGKDRCRLSVVCQYLCDVELLFMIPGKSFVPQPKVDVGVVKFVPLKEPLINVPFNVVNKVITHVFHYRQKEVKRGIQVLFPPDRGELAIEMIRRANINPSTRCTNLSMEEIAALCEAYQYICTNDEAIFEYNYRDKLSNVQWKKDGKRMLI